MLWLHQRHKHCPAQLWPVCGCEAVQAPQSMMPPARQEAQDQSRSEPPKGCPSTNQLDAGEELQGGRRRASDTAYSSIYTRYAVGDAGLLDVFRGNRCQIMSAVAGDIHCLEMCVLCQCLLANMMAAVCFSLAGVHNAALSVQCIAPSCSLFCWMSYCG